MNLYDVLDAVMKCPDCGRKASLIRRKQILGSEWEISVGCDECRKFTEKITTECYEVDVDDIDNLVEKWNNQENIIKEEDDKPLTMEDRMNILEKNYERLSDSINLVIKKQNRLIDILSNLRGKPIVHTPKYEPYTKDDELDF